MENETQLRVGIVGCGYQGGILAQTIGKLESLQVTACVDPDPSAAACVAAMAGNAATYASIEDMLSSAPLDMVIVATPHHLLYECALAAIHAGKHVLAEKPIGIDAKEAAQLEEAVARAGVCFMAGYSFRYLPGQQKAYELVQAGAVGEIHTVVGSMGAGSMSSGWLANPETGGGPLLYVGSHLVDEFLWYLHDDPVEVYAKVRYRADTRADETATFQIRFARGAVAQGMVTQSGTGFFNRLDIYGRQGRVSLSGASFDLGVEVVSNALPAYAQPTSIRVAQNDDRRILMHIPQLNEFMQAIRERRQPGITATDGRRVLQVLDAVLKSDHTGESVRIG